ncbi:hypothetical protein DSL72_003170 [Monilinia vaccinii-corymbosi]|uniref:Heterokaryon incompatibility domain-containing protein n=1 Tax=Monilinia vaccinii-corymbosi TaxID=61207 RepID=A0A8A3P1J6_9HELO|nr:hypothetical protein DSL72_003170 [Monilinia vaccinii-corymbosi]
MASNSPTSEHPASPPPAHSPQYRPLNHARNEFRLLKILPAADPDPEAPESNPMLFSSAPIQCQLQYASFPAIRRRVDNPGNGAEARPDPLDQVFSELAMEHDEFKGGFGEERLKMLLKRHQWSRVVLKMWGSQDFKFKECLFEDWLRTWIWNPLADREDSTERNSASYFALSYAWDRKFTIHDDDAEFVMLRMMATASGMTLREYLETRNTDRDSIDELCGKPGDSERGCEYASIIVDGKPVLVTKNLEVALRTLREIPEVASGTRIWVDALCINQMDVDEKNLEVRRMGEIYRNADRVISYLGEEAFHSGLALEYMDNIGRVTMPVRNGLATLFLTKTRMIERLASSVAGALSRTYFTRAWVVQEVVLGGDRSVVICGARIFSWKSLLRCGRVLEGGTWSDMGGEILQAVSGGVKNLLLFSDADVDFRRNGDDGKVLYLGSPWLRIPSSKLTTDPRDLIYGMLNLFPEKLSNLIHIDYAPRNRFVDVMRTFAEAHITSTQSLHWILYTCYLPFEGHDVWPTWVPNLAQRFSPARAKWPSAIEDAACPDIPCEFSFAEARQTDSRHVLVCKGIQVDVVHRAAASVLDEFCKKRTEMVRRRDNLVVTAADIAQYYPRANHTQSSHSAEKSLAILPPAKESFKGMQHPIHHQQVPIANTHRYEDTEGLKWALRKCCARAKLEVTGGYYLFSHSGVPRNPTRKGLNQILRERFLAHLTPDEYTYERLRDPFSSFKLWDTSFRELFPEPEPAVETLREEAPEEAVLGTLFTTTSGYVGVTLGNISRGDEVWLLAGCQAPVLLRRSPFVAGMHALMGGVYIPGLMNGEGLGGKEGVEGEFKTVTIY